MTEGLALMVLSRRFPDARRAGDPPRSVVGVRTGPVVGKTEGGEALGAARAHALGRRREPDGRATVGMIVTCGSYVQSEKPLLCLMLSPAVAGHTAHDTHARAPLAPRPRDAHGLRAQGPRAELVEGAKARLLLLEPQEPDFRDALRAAKDLAVLHAPYWGWSYGRFREESDGRGLRECEGM